MVNRRKVLALLGVGAATGPLATKALAEKEIAQLTMLNAKQLSVGSLEASNAFGSLPGGPPQSPYILASQYMKLMGKLPEFVEENLRERAKNVSHLDPDIACKKSWSLNVKIAAQRERNLKNEIERFNRNGSYEAAQSTFQKLTGFAWPW